MNFYENIIILDPNSAEKSVEETLEKVKNLIVQKGGEILKSENWGRKKLAYEIKKQKTGIYILLFFKAPSDTIGDLEKFYKLLDPLLKFLIIKLKKKQFDAVLSSMQEAAAKNTEAGQAGEERQNVQ